MPVEFLFDEQVAAYGRFTGEWSAASCDTARKRICDRALLVGDRSRRSGCGEELLVELAGGGAGGNTKLLAQGVA